MNPAPRTMAMPAADARAIARVFAPRRAWGNRYDYFYVHSKLRSDPLYPGVLQALRGSRAPLLDLGCGLGLLAHALRRDGQTMPYLGVDNDEAKIRRGNAALQRATLGDARLQPLDLATALPAHRGSVALLDVLQYLPASAHLPLVRQMAAMLEGDARLVMRLALSDASGRGRVTRLGDRLGNLVGWMQSQPRGYPDIDAIRGTLHDAGLATQLAPLYGATPFNNWLLVAQR